LWPHRIAGQVSLEPGHVALGVFPDGQAACPRQSAEERDEVRAGPDIDKIEIAAGGARLLDRFNRSFDDAVVIGVRLAVIVSEIRLGIELRPAIIGVAAARRLLLGRVAAGTIFGSLGSKRS
jgi:hypothetical protein